MPSQRILRKTGKLQDGGLERGGTSRKAKILNNIFYDCGVAASGFPTEDNEAEGNLYLCMTGGFLRIMYPAPEVCLDLKTWQEFYGFDNTGSFAWFAVEPDTDNDLLMVKERCDEPVNAPGPDKGVMLIRDPDEIKKVSTPEYVKCDINGESREHMSLPGPYTHWSR